MIVVKVGGAQGIGFDSLCVDLAEIIAGGLQVVVVHGGSHATNQLGDQLGHRAQFITSPSGHTSRRTDRRTLEIFQMACRGVVNQGLVLGLVKRGVRAVGISGIDAALWTGGRKAAVRSVEEGRVRVIRDDYTGTVERVDPSLLRTLLDAGFTPVISPPGLSEEFEPMNVDADRAASRTAVALSAEQLFLLSNVPGLLREFPDEGTLLTHVAPSELDMAGELAKGRMRSKVLAAREALGGGVSRVVIGDARHERPITRALNGAGTVFA